MMSNLGNNYMYNLTNSIEDSKSKIIVEPSTGQVMMENECGGQASSGFDVMKLYFQMSILSFLMHYQKNPTLFAVRRNLILS